jgi:hypothetical protein
MSRPSGVRRFAVRLDTEATLQVGGATVHNTRSDDGMPLKLLSQSFQKGAALKGMDWLRRLHDGGIFVIVQSERRWHGRTTPDGDAPR